jgi:hypothetical protein
MEFQESVLNMLHNRLCATEGPTLGYDGAGCQAAVHPLGSAGEILQSAP